MDWCQVRPHKNWGWFVLCLIEMKTKEYTYYQIIKNLPKLAQACWPTFSFKIVIEIRFLVLKTLEHKVILGALLAVMDQKTRWNHQSTLGTLLPGDNIQRNTEIMVWPGMYTSFLLMPSSTRTAVSTLTH